MLELKSMNKITIIILSIVAIFIFLFAAYKLTNTPDKTYADVNKISKTDHIKWAKDKKNILVEYSDLQCPACKSFYDFMKSDIEASGAANAGIMKKVTFVYRHFPLPQHAHGEDAAHAAEAAGKQGKFFEFVSLAFESQKTWAENRDAVKIFEGYAKDLDLNLDKFKKYRDLKEAKDKIAADLLSGQTAQVNATPTFYLNGKKLGPINSFADFLKPLKELK